MIHFIICDDEPKFIEKYVSIIEYIMMQNDIEYKIHKFTRYNDKFKEIMNAKFSFKVFILDIEVYNKSGIDIAKIIRKNDIDSMIIFCTAFFEKYLKEIIKGKLMYLDFIDKEGNYINELKDSIDFALKTIRKKNIIRFQSQNVDYTIYTNDILYIIRGKDRKCKIKISGNDNEIVINKSLTELMNMLDSRFTYSHRSCIINQDRISRFDKKNRVIIFDNDYSIDFVSSRFRLKSKK